LVAASHVGERARMSNVRKSEINGARPGAYWYGTEYFAQRRPQQAEPATATYFEALYSRLAVSKHGAGRIEYCAIAVARRVWLWIV